MKELKTISSENIFLLTIFVATGFIIFFALYISKNCQAIRYKGNPESGYITRVDYQPKSFGSSEKWTYTTKDNRVITKEYNYGLNIGDKILYDYDSFECN